MILVTGGTGLIGSHLLYYLLKENATVRATRRKESDLRQLRFIFQQLTRTENEMQSAEEKLARIEWVEADLLDTDALSDAMEGVDTIYHAAGMVDFTRKKAAETIRMNAGSTANVVNLCIEKNIRKLAYVSSVASIARKSDEVVNEDAKIEDMKFGSAYSESKFRAEMEVWRGIDEGLNAVMINPGVVLGFGDYGKGSLSIVRKVAQGMPVYPSGRNGYVDARDVATALIKLAGNDQLSGKRYIAVGANLTYLGLFTSLASCLGKKPPTIEAGKFLCTAAWVASDVLGAVTGRPFYVTRDLARTALGKFGYDSSRLINDTGFTFTPVEQTISDCCRAYREWETFS